jgi:hypothetical protein
VGYLDWNNLYDKSEGLRRKAVLISWLLPTLTSLLHELVLQLINHGTGTMELRLDPLSSSFNPYFYVIIGIDEQSPVDGHLVPPTSIFSMI